MSARFEAMKFVYDRFDHNGQTLSLLIIVLGGILNQHNRIVIYDAIRVMVDEGFLKLDKELNLTRNCTKLMIK